MLKYFAIFWENWKKFEETVDSIGKMLKKLQNCSGTNRRKFPLGYSKI